MKEIVSVVLAAGEGKRMKSKKSKLVHEVCGKALIERVCDEVESAGINEQIVVVGHKAEQVQACLKDKVKYVTQKEQLGTGHAIMQAKEYLENKEGNVFVLYGDTPLITSDTLSKTIKCHEEYGNKATVVTAIVDNPKGYGRIIRDQNNEFTKIVEDRDCDIVQGKVNEINSGFYCFDIKQLLSTFDKLSNDNDQSEYYLTDVLEILKKEGHKVGTNVIEDSNEILGINDRVQLAQATQIIQKRILNKHMLNGVTIIDTATTYISEDVKIGMDTTIYPSTILEGNTVIGEDCFIGPDSRIVNTKLGNNVEVKNSCLYDSCVDDSTNIGPFAYLRPGSDIGKNVKIGDFVEVKKAKIGDGTKLSHLIYVGDAEIGKNVNLGCGVVVVNYDGTNKNKTIVRDNAFVGCNTNLVAPVEVKENAYVAAGSTITYEVPENSLAIARQRQEVKKDWVINQNNK